MSGTTCVCLRGLVFLLSQLLRIDYIFFSGEGVTSYTATVLHAAKSLSKGLRGLGESVAHSLAGGRSTSQSPSPPHADIQRPGVVTILDIEVLMLKFHNCI